MTIGRLGIPGNKPVMMSFARQQQMERSIMKKLLGQIRSVAGPGIAVPSFGENTVMQLVGQAPRGTRMEIRRFRVKSFNDDHLNCHFYNAAADEEGTETIFVAKPYELRRTPFEGLTIAYPNSQNIAYTYSSQRTRSADDGTNTEDQVMTPDYFVDTEILAVTGLVGGTGVSPGGTLIVWEDINTAGRFWATAP